MPRAGFVVGRTGVARSTDKLPFLHPAQPSAARGIFGPVGHMEGAGRAEAMRRMSAPDQPISTVANFARATRRQRKEFGATVHPLSGRMMSLQRGEEFGTNVEGKPMTRTRYRAERLAARSQNPEVARRAQNVAEGANPGPRPIQVHSHPSSASTKLRRQMPSATDLIGPTQGRGSGRFQNVVVTQRREGAGRGGKNTSAVWSGPVPGRRTGRLERGDALRRDLGTQDKAFQDTVGMSPAVRRAAVVSRGVRRLQRAAGRVEADYDADVARRYGGRQAARASRGGAKDPVPMYVRQNYLKRDAGRLAEDEAYEDQLLTRRKARAQRNATLRKITLDVPGRLLHADKRKLGLAALAGGGSGTTAYVITDRRETKAARDDKRRGRQAAAAVASGGVAQGVYQGAAYGTGAYTRRRTGHNLKDAEQARGNRDLHPSLRSPEAWTAHHDKRKAHLKDAPDFKTAYRTFPRELKYSLAERVQGFTHGGKTGTAIGTALTIGAAGAGAAKAKPRRVSKPESAKRDTRGPRVVAPQGAQVGYRTVETDPLRVGEGAVGAALLGWGLPRHSALASVLDHAVYEAERRGGGAGARRAYVRGSGWMSSARDLTGSGAKAARRSKTVAGVVDRIPVKARPAVATAIGGILLSNARPVRREHFTPVGAR